jgi:hypothetical protein
MQWNTRDQGEMYHRHNLQWTALPVAAVLSGDVVVRAAHVAPWHLLYDPLTQTAGAATRAVTKASWRMLPLSVVGRVAKVAFVLCVKSEDRRYG